MISAFTSTTFAKSNQALPMKLTTLTTLLAALTRHFPAADWPQWGGKNNRNMYSPQRGLPDAFGKIEFKPGTEEISTNAVKNSSGSRHKLGSQSYGNVTVSGGKVFIGTNNEPNRDPKHRRPQHSPLLR